LSKFAEVYYRRSTDYFLYNVDYFVKMLSILLSALLLSQGVIGGSIPEPLPEIKYADLVNMDINVAKSVVQHLTTLGAAQITGIPSFSKTRKRALEDLASCLVDEKTGVSAIMSDGSKRLSTAAASKNGKAGAMDNVCGEAADRLRSSVDSTSFLLFQAMDTVLHQESTSDKLVMGPHYKTYSDLMNRGSHLEHLHAYFAPTTVSSAPKPTLDYHIDAGLMIAMTTGFYQNTQPSDNSGLYIQMPNGEERKAIADEDALIVLMGDGSSRWLAPVLGALFRGIPHKLVVDLPVGKPGSRSWYGKMYLPPADAVIPQEEMKYSEYSQLVMKFAPTTKFANENPFSYDIQDLLPSACGSSVSSSTEGRIMTANDDNCPVGQLYCWARCMPTTDLPCGDNAVCFNSDTKEISPGELHCSPGSACNPTCLDEPVGNSSSNGYCIGTGTSMFMQGFVSIVNEDSGNTECVNLWFTEWTLDSKLKYGFACIGVFLFCIFIQYLHTLRSSINKVAKDKQIRVVLNVLLYGLNVTCGYFAMLVAMTYSVELFCMICVGMTVGYGIFHADKNTNAHAEDGGALESESVHQPLIKSKKPYVPPSSSMNATKPPADSEDYGNCCAGNDTA
jgi:hypothetical protein